MFYNSFRGRLYGKLVAPLTEFQSDEPIVGAEISEEISVSQLRYEIDQLQQEITECHLQISNDFEELALLRSFAEYLEGSETYGGLLSMARKTLPLLRHAVKAESIVLAVDTTDTDSGFGEHPSPYIWGGPQLVEDAVVKWLVNHYRECAIERPVVKNHVIHSKDANRLKGLREFVLVHVAKGDRVMGWILALNRLDSDVANKRSDSFPLPDTEFGTGQATLLSSASSMIAAHMRNVEQFREKEKLLVNMVRALVSAIEAKDDYTRGHSERVALYAACLGRSLGLDQQDCEKLYLTGLVHDVGKIGVSDATLGKVSKLTDTEFDEIKQHPDMGWAILQDLDQLAYVLPGVVYHHERYDGQGYPDGLSGTQIPRDGRIVAIADAYDAVTSDRPYRKGMSQEKAEEILREGSGTQWDADMVEAFLQAMPQILEIQRQYQRDRNAPRRPKQLETAATDTPEAKSAIQGV